MKTSDFDFDLPEELIARYPLERRSGSRLLFLKEGEVQHQTFEDLPNLLTDKDVLIFNNTKVIRARLFARKKTGGKVEILIERILPNQTALAHVKANKSLVLPLGVILSNGIEVMIGDRHGDLFTLQFHCELPIRAVLDEIGEIPLPNYMQRPAELLDHERYQTIYGTQEGAVAAPTAGLHFDETLLAQLIARGIKQAFITLHVGAGTFKPVLVEDVTAHIMHHEIYEINQDTCDLINQTKSSGGRVVAVGTTTVRALETAMQHHTQLAPCSGETGIFIYPGYQFKCIDAMITNFHLPKSTLLMLVCALGGYEEVMVGYQIAIRERYRFYSYGDAMFVRKRQWSTR